MEVMLVGSVKLMGDILETVFAEVESSYWQVSY